MSRRLKILFTISILLNLLLIGSHVGMAVKHHYGHARVYADLSPETQSLVARAFQAAREEMSKTHGEFKKVRGDIDKILSTKEFDKEAYTEALTRMQDVQQKMTAQKIKIIADLMAEVPPQERQTLSHRVMRMFDKERPRRRKFSHDHGTKEGGVVPSQEYGRPREQDN